MPMPKAPIPQFRPPAPVNPNLGNDDAPPAVIVDPELLSPAAKEKYMKEKATAAKERIEEKIWRAWAITKYPPNKFAMPGYKERTLSLPRSYRAKGMADKTGMGSMHVVVKPGDDLNKIVWKWYNGRIEEDEVDMYLGMQNYVGRDIIARRHEYLGPSPHVAGFSFFAANEVRIQWWDSFLQDRWIQKDAWNVDMELAGSKWREIQM